FARGGAAGGSATADRPAGAARVPRPPSPERLAEALRGGWPPDGGELGAWLDALYGPAARGWPAAGLAPPVTPTPAGDDRPWFEMAEAAAAGPVGIYEPPQLIGQSSTSQSLDNARRMALAVLA